MFRKAEDLGLDRRSLAGICVTCIAYAAIAFSFGALATASDFPTWLSVAFSTIVYAGGSQFAALHILGNGGGFPAAVAAALILNARFLPFGLAISDVFSGARWRLLLGVHLIVDAPVAMALQETDVRRRRAIFWIGSLALFVVWIGFTAIGAIGGRAFGNIALLGFDAALPLVLLAPLIPLFRDRQVRRASIAGATIALATAPLLPAGYPLLLALTGLLVRGRKGDAA